MKKSTIVLGGMAMVAALLMTTVILPAAVGGGGGGGGGADVSVVAEAFSGGAQARTQSRDQSQSLDEPSCPLAGDESPDSVSGRRSSRPVRLAGQLGRRPANRRPGQSARSPRPAASPLGPSRGRAGRLGSSRFSIAAVVPAAQSEPAQQLLEHSAAAQGHAAPARRRPASCPAADRVPSRKPFTTPGGSTITVAGGSGSRHHRGRRDCWRSGGRPSRLRARAAIP